MLAPLAIAAVLIAGHSAQGRPIVAHQRGDPGGAERVLVVGCIHGTECAGMRVVRVLRRMPLPPGIDLWLVPDLDPDGLAHGTRLNGRGVDLNRNFPAGWRPGGRPGDLQYPGPRPFSEPESRAARRLIDQVRPDVTIWYHQRMDVVWAWGPSRAAGAAYAHAAGMWFAPMRWLAGTAPHWQNTALKQRSFVVELPGGTLSAAAARRQARGVLAAARQGTGRAARPIA
jgi:murein peptide amidase A